MRKLPLLLVAVMGFSGFILLPMTMKPGAARADLAPPPGKLVQFPGQTPEPPIEGSQPKATPVPVVPAPSVPPPPPFMEHPVLPQPSVIPPPSVLPAPSAPVPPCDPPTPVVVLSVRVVACSPEGQEIHYKICIENTSPAAAHHVLVKNPLPPNAKFVQSIPMPTKITTELQWDFGTLPGLCCKEIHLVLQPIGDGDVKNCARVQFEHGQCVITRIAKLGPPGIIPVPGQGPPVMPPGKKPPVMPPAGVGKLTLDVNGPATSPLNQPVTYTISLRNTGDAPATNAMIACDLPANTEFVQASKGGQFLANHVAWLVGTIAPSEEKTVTLTFKAKAGGKICLKPFAVADGDLQATEEKCTLFQGGFPALGLRMEDTLDPVEVGKETSYVIVVKNQGGVPVTNLEIKAFVPKEMVLVNSKGPVNYKVMPAATGGQIVLFEPLKSLDPDQEANYQVFVKALQPGDVRFKIEMTADQIKKGGPVTEEEATRIFADDVPLQGISLQGIVEPLSKKKSQTAD